MSERRRFGLPLPPPPPSPARVLRGLREWAQGSDGPEPETVQVTQVTQIPHLERPGCVAADETLTVIGHLQGLSQGWGGFGVLRTSKERLLRAAQGARQMGARSLAAELEEKAKELFDVRDPQAAQNFGESLWPLARQTWVLGQRCGGRYTPEQIRMALDQALANYSKEKVSYAENE